MNQYQFDCITLGDSTFELERGKNFTRKAQSLFLDNLVNHEIKFSSQKTVIINVTCSLEVFEAMSKEYGEYLNNYEL